MSLHLTYATEWTSSEQQWLRGRQGQSRTGERQGGGCEICSPDSSLLLADSEDCNKFLSVPIQQINEIDMLRTFHTIRTNMQMLRQSGSLDRDFVAIYRVLAPWREISALNTIG